MSASKTEEPTPRRLREARRRGEVPKSRELVSAVSLLAGLAVMSLTGPRLVAAFPSAFEAVLGSEPGDGLGRTLAVLSPASAVLIVIFFVSASVAFAQVGPLWAPKAVAVDARRLDPTKGAKRLFSRDRAVDLVRHLSMLAVASAVTVVYLRDHAPAVARLLRMEATSAIGTLGELLFGLAVRLGTVLALFAIGDLLLQRRRHRRSLRMSKDEVRRDHREAEGDPHGKQARARAHREAVEHGTLEEVRRASVLVVNPTHFAVALRFDEESDQEAPEVIAKGVDDLARRMIDVARECVVPVVRDVPLARALHELELGDEIPETFYQAVAAILEVAAAERDAT
jgi:type III secretion protein U